jgi:hypothetical protein
MAGPTVNRRCPACGADLRIVLAPAPPTQWFPCPNCHAPIPVVVPHDPPPLFSWEVSAGLYPPLPAPRIPKWKPRRAAGYALLVVALVAIVLAGILAYDAVAATAPGSYTVSGTVLAESSGGSSPALGARAVLLGENGYSATTTIGPSGTFAFAGVPTGGVSINFTLAGYSPVSISAFVSSVYSAGDSGIVVTLDPGTAANASGVAYTPFPTLESFLASIGAAIVLLGLTAIVAALAAWVTVKSDRPAVGVVGGSAGVFAPLVLYFLALGGPFPLILLGTGIAATIGAFAVGSRAIEMAQTGAAAGTD